jgi:cytochrome bd ubiquinol oxidase subunit II
VAFYLPLILMLLALIFRGVAFEFRFKASRTRPLWDRAFAWGSTVATFMQGLVLGTFIHGTPVEDRSFAGGPFDWLTPFSVMTGLFLVAGYALLGATWLIMKTEGDLQEWAFRTTRPILIAVLAGIAVVSLWTPLRSAEIAERWFSLPNLFYLSPVPLLVIATGGFLWRAVERKRDYQPFLLSLALFTLSYAGLAISLWPYVIPRSVTIWEAASPDSSLVFLLVGTSILIPIILVYTAYTYWIFRGKTTSAGYH